MRPICFLLSDLTLCETICNPRLRLMRLARQSVTLDAPAKLIAVGTTLRGRDCNSGRLHREELLHGLIYDEDQDMPGCCCSVCVPVCLSAMLTCLLRKLLASRALVCFANSSAAQTRALRALLLHTNTLCQYALVLMDVEKTELR